MRRIPKPKERVLKQDGRVMLLELVDPNYGTCLYAVRFPHKVGSTESSLTMMSQFLRRDEAETEFVRYAKFFSKKEGQHE